MGAIDTILLNDMSFRMGAKSYTGAENLPFRVWATVAFAMVAVRLQKRRTRKHLMHLNSDQLRDIGLSRAEAEREIRASFPHWYFDDRT